MFLQISSWSPCGSFWGFRESWFSFIGRSLGRFSRRARTWCGSRNESAGKPTFWTPATTSRLCPLESSSVFGSSRGAQNRPAKPHLSCFNPWPLTVDPSSCSSSWRTVTLGLRSILRAWRLWPCGETHTQSTNYVLDPFAVLWPGLVMFSNCYNLYYIQQLPTAWF